MGSLNIIKVCVNSLILIFCFYIIGCQSRHFVKNNVIVFNEAMSEDSIFGESHSIFIHGDTLSFLQNGGHLGPTMTMDNVYSFNFKKDGDTLKYVGQNLVNRSPLSFEWDWDEIDSVIYSDHTPHYAYPHPLSYLSAFGFPVLTDLRSKSYLSDYTSFCVNKHDSTSNMALPHPTRISDLALSFFGIKFRLKDYRKPKLVSDSTSFKTARRLIISYNIEDLFRSMKYVLKGDSIEIFDWENRKLQTLERDTVILKLTRYTNGDIIIEKRFNYEKNKSKFDDGRIY